MIDNELLEIDRSFNSYKGTIVINSIISKIYLLISFNSYKGTIVIVLVQLVTKFTNKLQFL